MSRPDSRYYQQLRQARRQAAQTLRREQHQAGLAAQPRPTLPNRQSELRTLAEEQAERQLTVEGQFGAFRARLPSLIQRLRLIPDPRDPRSVKHKLTVLLLYGLCLFVLQFASRREAGRELSRPQFWQNLRLLFPELESLPHPDTLNRVLARIEVEEIQAAMADLIERLIRHKKFWRYLVDQRYLVAIDGTQKFVRDVPWAAEALQRQVGAPGAAKPQFYVYCLEASLVFPGGISIPLHTEFLEYTDGDVAKTKQDGELKAFYRLAQWLKGRFPRLPITLLLDGLYANGPVIALCHQYNWQFMIVLRDGCLSQVWQEARALRQLEPDQVLRHQWGNRQQDYWWVNRIVYEYGQRQQVTLHVVVCEEQWTELAPDSTALVHKQARHAWLSSQPLTPNNVHRRCNLMARHRWEIESDLLVEKCHGYGYEHCFSYNWKAMKGFHYLMRLAHLFNVLAHLSLRLAKQVATLGVRGLIRFVRETLAAPWLDVQQLKLFIAQTHQLRLV